MFLTAMAPLPLPQKRNAPFIPMAQAQGLSGAVFGNTPTAVLAPARIYTSRSRSSMNSNLLCLQADVDCSPGLAPGA
jgi:hypothetical protein